MRAVKASGTQNTLGVGVDGEGRKEWYCQFGVATSTYSYKNAVLLEVVEGLEMDEVTTEDVELKSM